MKNLYECQKQRLLCSCSSVESIVKNLETHRGQKYPLLDHATHEEKYMWKVGLLEDTIYKDISNVLQQWEDCYLPDHVNMQVLGEVHHISRDYDDTVLVLMMGNNEVYAYTDEDLHLVAKNIKILFTEGISFPSEKVYHYWDCFLDMVIYVHILNSYIYLNILIINVYYEDYLSWLLALAKGGTGKVEGI